MRVGAALIGFAAMPLFGGPGMAGHMQIVGDGAIVFGSVWGYLTPVQCDAQGCWGDENYRTYFGDFFVDGVTVEGFYPSITGYTDGGLKDTMAFGSFGGGFTQNYRTPSGIGVSVDAFAQLIAADDLYSADVYGAASVSLTLALNGLPTDRFEAVNPGLAAITPSAYYQGPQGVDADGLLRPGHYDFFLKSSFSLFYQCDPCGPGSHQPISLGDGFFDTASLAFTRSEAGAWRQIDAGVTSPPAAALPIDDGNRLLIGGAFPEIAGAQAGGVAIWDGAGWATLQHGVDGAVGAAAEWNGSIVVGGEFTAAAGVAASNIARWNGAAWEPMHDGLNGKVRALTVVGGKLYAGGDFTASGSTPVSHLARWDSAQSRWAPVLPVDGPVHALESLATEDTFCAPSSVLILGGDFNAVGGVSAGSLAAIDVGAPTPSILPGIDGVSDGVVLALDSYVGWDPDSFDYAPMVLLGGQFSENRGAGPQLSNIALLNVCSGSMDPLAGGVAGGEVRCLAVHSTLNTEFEFSNDEPVGSLVIVAAGSFTQAGGVPVQRVARYESASWSPIGDGLNGDVNAVALWNDEVVLAGDFSGSGARPIQRLARWTLDSPPCRGDASGDNAVDFSDLNAVLVAFGQSGAPGFSPADLDGDGSVGFSDLNAVLVAFGSTCD